MLGEPDPASRESIATYGYVVENTRKTELGVLGHDLRVPLDATNIASGLLQKTDYLQERARRFPSTGKLPLRSAQKCRCGLNASDLI